MIAGIDRILRKLGGTARRWRFDRMSAVVTTGTGKVLPSFLAAAKHYGAGVDICPPRRGNRKGAVESRNHFTAQRWWRTADVRDVPDAEQSFDRFCVEKADALPRADGTVGEVAATEHLLAVPAQAFPAEISVPRRVDRQARVAYEGNFYAVAPRLVGHQVTVRVHVGGDTLEIVAGDVVVATHRRAPVGSGATVRTPGQRDELEKAVLSSFSTDRPCRRKENRPPNAEAKALAAVLRSGDDATAKEVVVDLQRYAPVAEASR